jgi:hypothetical protein
MLTVESATNPLWANAEHTAIILQVKFEEFAEVLPFTADPNDVMPYGVVLFNNAIDGQYGEIAPFVPLPESIQPQTNIQTA